MAQRRVMQGRVRSFDAERGLGEIELESGDVLSVHRSALRGETVRSLYPGDLVAFVQGRDRFGRRAALEVQRVGWDEEEEVGDDEAREWTF